MIWIPLHSLYCNALYCTLRWREWHGRRITVGLPEGIHRLRCKTKCSSVRLIQVKVRPHLTIFLQCWSVLWWTEHAAPEQVTRCHIMSYNVMSCHVMSCHVMRCDVMLCYVMLWWWFMLYAAMYLSISANRLELGLACPYQYFTRVLFFWLHCSSMSV